MRVFFWDFDDYNDIEREWAMFVINIIAFLFAGWALMQTARYHRRCIFELLPLSINAIATLVLLILKLFQRGYEFDLLGFLIELFTYFLFWYTFGQIHFKVFRPSSYAPKQEFNELRIYNIVLLLFVVFLLVTAILVVTGIISKDCDSNLLIPGVISFSTQLFSLLPTAYYGIDIIKKITKRNIIKKIDNDTFGMFSSASDQYVNERKKQIWLVLLAYTSSVILRGVILLMTSLLDDYFECSSCEGIYILTSDNAIGQFLLVLIELNQLIPHVVIPVALYVIPVKTVKHTIKLEEELVDDEEIDQSEEIQRRVSNSIMTRSNSSLKSMDTINSQ